MGYRKLRVFISSFIVLLFLIGYASCSNGSKENSNNTFYIELVNFTNDSLKQSIYKNILGKVSYYEKDVMKILSKNYLSEDYPKMHYYKLIEDLSKSIESGSKKIRVEFGGTYSVDSVSYSLQKFEYKSNEWIKFSDMGFLKATTSYKKAKIFAIDEFGKQIANNIAAYTYD